MATIILQVPDEAMVKKVMQTCKMLKGVTSVKLQKPVSKKKLDVTKTASFLAAKDDVKHGRVTTYASLNDFKEEIYE